MPMERLKLSDFDYPLPKELIAQEPCAKREDSRLLILERAKKKLTHRTFSALVDYLSAGDCLVLNNTRVICARMIGRRETYSRPGDTSKGAKGKVRPGSGGGKQEIFLLENLSKNTYRVLAKPAKKLSLGAKVLFNNGKVSATVLAEEGMSKIVRFSANGDTQDFWHKFGQVPLPPYIKREPQGLDKERYQTVYATEGGATAAPTAGLHFTRELLEVIRAKGVKIVYLTLHINYGTFAPVKSEDISKHKMHKEYFILPAKTKALINAARLKGRKVFAVGTTSVRVLETCAKRAKETKPLSAEVRGRTDLFIYPSYGFKTVDCLLTNFHFPKSTLLMLVSAFAGKELIFKAYREAIEKRYRFFSYGDAMLIL